MSLIEQTPTTVENPMVDALITHTQPEAPAAPIVPTQVADVRLTSAQLKERLDETRASAERRVLAELGFDDLGKAKAMLTKAAPRNDEKWAQLESTAAQQATKLAEMESLLASVTNERAIATLASLPEQARKAIEDATDDDEERIALAKVLTAAGVSNPIQVLPVVQQPAVSTAPQRSAPADSSATPPNRKQEYDRLKKINPVAAAHYLKAFGRDIFPG